MLEPSLPEPLAAIAAAEPALFWPLALVLSLAVLVRSADWFTEAAEIVGRAAGLSPFIIGVVIVACGTSLPELVASVLAVLRDASEIVMGNAIGSNIANLGLVLGLGAVVGDGVATRRHIARLDLPMLTGATALATLMALDGRVVRLEAALLVTGLAIYLHLALRGRSESAVADGRTPPGRMRALRAAGVLVASGLVIWLGAEGTVRSVGALATLFGIASETIAATAVALGTSLPELAVTLLAARRGHAELALGNIVGSNVFNLLAVAGLSGLVGPILVPESLVNLALPTMAALTVVAAVMLATRTVSRWEGAFLLVAYLWFLLAVTGLLA